MHLILSDFGGHFQNTIRADISQTPHASQLVAIKAKQPPSLAKRDAALLGGDRGSHGLVTPPEMLSPHAIL
ncbi:MAG: hypothetical protein F6J93_17485 [Oscillatoria sp. SIO1A7]|nr:hypothetical protein [Oscillatoria sp. SIO1A7]